MLTYSLHCNEDHVYIRNQLLTQRIGVTMQYSNQEQPYTTKLIIKHILQINQMQYSPKMPTSSSTPPWCIDSSACVGYIVYIFNMCFLSLVKTIVIKHTF